MKKQYDQKDVKPKRSNRAVRILWQAFIIGALGFTLLIVLINYGVLGYMPSMNELENPSSALSSDVLAGDGSLIGRYYVQDRSNSKYQEISENVFNALLATEDARFYDHAGIDPIATLAIPMYIVTGKKRGSSTLTQQLAKNLFPRQKQSVLTMPIIKLKEWVLAIKLERKLTKNEIITLYLNTVPFGDNVYGIRNASLTFYNKTPDKLTVDEAAMLVGLLKGNTLYNPRRNPARALDRRNVVLDQMNKYGYLSADEEAKLSKKPIVLDYHKIDYNEGIAPYFRQVVEAQVKQVCKDLKKPDGSNYDIYKDGLKIYTTLDMRMQRYAEQAVEEHISAIQKIFTSQSGYRDGSIWNTDKSVQAILKNSIKSCDRYQNMKDDDMTDTQAMAEMRKPVKMRVFAWNKDHYKDTVMSPIDSIKYMKIYLQAGFMAMDPFTGEVKAWVGGIDHTYFQYDHVNINTKRQVGSTIKPLLYCFAVDNGFSPCSTISTAPQSFPTKAYYDAGGSERGNVTMKYALALSVNNAALYILKQVGIDAFVDFAHKCGITSQLDKFPSVALGVSDISLFEMMGAYSMFPDGGINTQPFFITKIEDKNGMLLKNFAPAQKEIINANTAYKMVNMMRGVVDFGTGVRMRNRYGIKSDVAGKTGTTNNQADAWFIGYTPQLLAGAWVGCDDRVFRFRSEELGQGSAAALPIWALFMKRVYADKSLGISADAKFKPPADYSDCDVFDPTSLSRSSTYGSGSTGTPANSTNTDPQEQVEPSQNNDEWQNP